VRAQQNATAAKGMERHDPSGHRAWPKGNVWGGKLLDGVQLSNWGLEGSAGEAQHQPKGEGSGVSQKRLEEIAVWPWDTRVPLTIHHSTIIPVISQCILRSCRLLCGSRIWSHALMKLHYAGTGLGEGRLVATRQ